LKTVTAFAALTIALIPMSVSAAKSKPKTPAKAYECSTCHMKFTAAQAKKDHYKDPMDGGKLVPVAATPKKPMSHMDGGSMGGMKM